MQNPVATLPVPSRDGTGVAAAHAEYARQFGATFSLSAMFLVLVASSSTA